MASTSNSIPEIYRLAYALLPTLPWRDESLPLVRKPARPKWWRPELLLAIPLAAGAAWWFGEWSYLPKGLVGAALFYTVIWFGADIRRDLQVREQNAALKRLVGRLSFLANRKVTPSLVLALADGFTDYCYQGQLATDEQLAAARKRQAERDAQAKARAAAVLAAAQEREEREARDQDRWETLSRDRDEWRRRHGNEPFPQGAELEDLAQRCDPEIVQPSQHDHWGPVNPANGLPMVNGTGIDVSGHAFGTGFGGFGHGGHDPYGF